MQKLNGGYVMIDLNDTNNIYARAKAAIGCGKPIMLFDDPECYYADSIKLVGDDVVITKGGKSITINDANAVSSEGEILTIMENIVDKNGDKRFIEIDLTPSTISGFDFTYSKASLSGSHLMIVLAGNITSGSTLANNTELVIFNLPDYIRDKMVAIIGTTISYNYSEIIASDYTTTSVRTRLIKSASNLDIRAASDYTFSKDYSFRIQYDLLIDAE